MILVGIIITVIAYAISRRIASETRISLLNPIVMKHIMQEAL